MQGNSKLFSFIFLTVKASANDPKSKNFLPTLLAAIKDGGSPLLPLTEDSWKIGELAGSNGSWIAQQIAEKYYLINGDTVSPYSKDPDPSLDLKDPTGTDKVIIKGLENVYVTGFDNYNYDESTQSVTADVKMQFNYWTKNPGGLQPGQKVTPLGLDTPFVLTQQLCKSASLNDSKCLDASAKPITMEGIGTFTADITQLNFTASIKVNVEPNRAGLDLAVTKLDLITTGSDAPQFTNVDAKITNSPDYQDVISALITSFMSAPDASEAVFSQMQTSLNGNDNINALSATLKQQIGDFLDARLGPVTGPLPSDKGQEDTNMVDLYLFDRIRYSLNNPSSQWYVKTLLESYKNPPLNPFKPQNLNIGSFEILAGFTLNDVTLSNIVVTGFPNATVPADQMLLIPPTLHIQVLLGSLGTGTTATADFSAKYTGGTLKFGITVVVKSVQLNSVVTPSGDQASELVITFNSLQYKIPTVSAMQITISDKTGLGPAVEKVLNTTDVQDKIVAAANSQIKAHLTDINNEVTSLIKEMLNQQLGSS